MILTLAAIQNLIRSKHGRAVTSIRDSEIAARATGINVTKYKLMVFTVSAFFAGIAFLAYSSALGKKQRLKEEEYESAYPLFGTKYSRAKNEESQKEEENKDEVD